VGAYLHFNGPETVLGSQGKLLTAALTTAELYTENTGWSGNGANRTAIYEGPGLTTGVNVTRFIDCFGEYEAASGTFGLTLTIDTEDMPTITLDTGTSEDVYGTAVYGTGTYADRTRRLWSTMFPLNSEGRTAQIALQFTGMDDLIVYNYHLGLVPEPMPRGF
jgi:hypothetical protein